MQITEAFYAAGYAVREVCVANTLYTIHAKHKTYSEDNYRWISITEILI